MALLSKDSPFVVCFPEAGRGSLDSWFCLMLLVPWQSPAKGSAGEWSSPTPFNWDLCCVQHVPSWDRNQFLLGRSPSQPQPSPLLYEPRGPSRISLLQSSQLCRELLVCWQWKS